MSIHSCRSLYCHNVEVNLATFSFCGYCSVENSGVCLFLNLCASRIPVVCRMTSRRHVKPRYLAVQGWKCHTPSLLMRINVRYTLVSASAMWTYDSLYVVMVMPWLRAMCWMLDVGCWMLGVGCWMLDV